MDDNKDRRYEDRHKDYDRRFQAIEKELCVISKPELGVLAVMKKEMNDKISGLHERISKELSHGPRWTVFWSVIVLFTSIILGSYGYTYMVTTAISDKYDVKYERLVTKEDFKEFKKEILEKFSQLENKIENKR